MFEHKFGYVEWLTEKFYALAASLGLNRYIPQKDMDHVWMALIVTLFLIVFFAFWKKKYKVYPSVMQQVLEIYYRFIDNLVRENIGPEGKRYVPLIGTMGLFILLSNLLGLIPIFHSPTGNINVTLGCAIFVAVYYHVEGIRRQGLFGYLKHFMGPVVWLFWLFIPVEIISHLARPLSLTIRLFGNIFGEDTIISILGSKIFAFVVPVPLMCLAIFTSLVQTLVFIMLSCIYISGAVAHEHEEHAEESPVAGHSTSAHSAAA